MNEVKTKKAYHTPEGGKHISQNAFKYGLTAKKFIFMPCRRNCAYRSVCNLHQIIYANDNSENEYIPCPAEVALYFYIKYSFDNHPGLHELDKALINEYIKYSILLERCRKCISMYSDTIDSNKKYYIYFNRYYNKARKLFMKIINIGNFQKQKPKALFHHK